MIYMAKKTIKLSQLSKDFAMKSKDVLDTFKDLGLEKKSGAKELIQGLWHSCDPCYSF